MLADRKEEQQTLFKEIIARKLTVRDTEQMARRVAVERVRNHASLSPDVMALEKQLTESLGTRVRIEKKEKGRQTMGRGNEANYRRLFIMGRCQSGSPQNRCGITARFILYDYSGQRKVCGYGYYEIY
jgi:hypothetical protein